MNYVELNDVFFNQNTVSKLDERASDIIKRIDDSKLIGKYKIESKFNGVTLDIDCLSTGCKTVLNVMYFPNMVFCMKECGDNALEILYKEEKGFVYSDYAVIPSMNSPIENFFGRINLSQISGVLTMDTPVNCRNTVFSQWAISPAVL